MRNQLTRCLVVIVALVWASSVVPGAPVVELPNVEIEYSLKDADLTGAVNALNDAISKSVGAKTTPFSIKGEVNVRRWSMAVKEKGKPTKMTVGEAVLVIGSLYGVMCEPRGNDYVFFANKAEDMRTVELTEVGATSAFRSLGLPVPELNASAIRRTVSLSGKDALRLGPAKMALAVTLGLMRHDHSHVSQELPAPPSQTEVDEALKEFPEEETVLFRALVTALRQGGQGSRLGQGAATALLESIDANAIERGGSIGFDDLDERSKANLLTAVRSRAVRRPFDQILGGGNILSFDALYGRGVRIERSEDGGQLKLVVPTYNGGEAAIAERDLPQR